MSQQVQLSNFFQEEKQGLVERLKWQMTCLTKCEALSSNPSTAKKKTKQQQQKR
jgi:hypothetical protein